MADYTPWDINALLPGEPWTTDKAIAAFENLDAVAEGAPGAPRIAARALGGLLLTQGSASRTSSGSDPAFVVTDMEDISEVLILSRLSVVMTTPAQVEYNTSTNNGASWSSPVVIGATNLSNAQIGFVQCVDVSGTINALRVRLNQTSTGESSLFAQLLVTGGIS